jgi:hypothetical protein
LFKNVTVETGTEAIEAFGGRVVARDPPNKSLVFYLPVAMVEFDSNGDLIRRTARIEGVVRIEEGKKL